MHMHMLYWGKLEHLAALRKHLSATIPEDDPVLAALARGRATDGKSGWALHDGENEWDEEDQWHGHGAHQRPAMVWTCRQEGASDLTSAKLRSRTSGTQLKWHKLRQVHDPWPCYQHWCAGSCARPPKLTGPRKVKNNLKATCYVRSRSR